MVTTTSNVLTFDKSLYQALNEKAVKYFREDPDLNWVPQKIITPNDVPEYKKPIFGNSIGVTGQTNLGLNQQVMDTPKSHNVYKLQYVRGDIKYDVNDMMMEGRYLVQRKAQELATWEDQVKQAVFKGVRTGTPTATGTPTMYDENGIGQGQTLTTGIIEQATPITDLNGTDSLLNAAGDVNLALTKMLQSIPARFRAGRKVIMGMDDLFSFNGRKVLFRGSTNQQSELDMFFSEHASELATPNLVSLTNAMINPKPVVSDKLFLNQVAGVSKTEVDTKGTHSRLFAAVVDPEVLEQAYSRIGMVGEDRVNTIQQVLQNWSARVKGCVHQPLAVVYSEQITW